MLNTISLFVLLGLFLLIASAVKEITDYRNMVAFFYAISNGFKDDWYVVSYKLKMLDTNPYPNVTKEMYENEQRRQLGRSTSDCI